MTAIAVPDILTIPEVPWPDIRSRLLQRWDIRDAPHHSIIGQTRSGKSYLARYGILTTCRWDKVLFIDCKGDDKTIVGLGHPVRAIPNKALRSARQLFQDKAAGENWFRLVTDPNTERARDQVGRALETVMRQGDWTVITDELRYLTDSREPGLGLRGLWEQIILRGGSRGVGMVSLSQEPRWVPSSFYTQSSFYWFSRIEDEAALKRVAEVGSSRQLLEKLKVLPRRKWIYMDALDDERFWAMTTVTGGPR